VDLTRKGMRSWENSTFSTSHSDMVSGKTHWQLNEGPEYQLTCVQKVDLSAAVCADTLVSWGVVVTLF